MQNQTRIARTVAVIIALVILGGGYYWWTHSVRTGSLVPTADSTLINASSTVASTTIGSDTVTALADGSYTITAVPVTERPEAINYKRDLVFDASVNAPARAAMQAQFTAAKAVLAKNPIDFDALITIGNLRLIGGDAAGSKEVWDYVSKLYPQNIVTFNNLGDYYTNYQKDYAKAEANFLIAIKNKSNDPAGYRNLFNLYYTIGYKRTGTAAEDILKKGISAAPKAVDLQVLLARFYRDTGRKTEAKAEYNVAITTATSVGQTSTVTALQTERDAF